MPSLNFKKCWNCEHKIIQNDMLDDNKTEIVGCKLLTIKEWEKGIREGLTDKYQSDCEKRIGGYR